MFKYVTHSLYVLVEVAEKVAKLQCFVTIIVKQLLYKFNSYALNWLEFLINFIDIFCARV